MNTATSTTTSSSNTPEANLGFVLDNFVTATDGVVFAQTVSADGMHLAASMRFDRACHDTFAAIASGLSSLTDGAVELFGVGQVHRQIIEADHGWILLSRLSETATIGVVADEDADLGMIGYEMTRLSRQLGTMLSPEVVDRLKRTLQVGS